VTLRPDPCYTWAMCAKHPKAIRRRILRTLYDSYVANPMAMLSAEDLVESVLAEHEDIVFNTFYLHDRGLVELMHGYVPNSFSAVRISADGIDLVENHFEFNLRFPETPDGLGPDPADAVPALVMRLLAEADNVPLDGEARRSLLRDVAYLRDELARPVARWRGDVLDAVAKWIAEAVDGDPGALPSLEPLRQAVARTRHPTE